MVVPVESYVYAFFKDDTQSIEDRNEGRQAIEPLLWLSRQQSADTGLICVEDDNCAFLIGDVLLKVWKGWCWLEQPIREKHKDQIRKQKKT